MFSFKKLEIIISMKRWLKMNRITNQSINQSLTHSTNQPIDQLINRPINQSITRPIYPPIADQSINRSNDQADNDTTEQVGSFGLLWNVFKHVKAKLYYKNEGKTYIIAKLVQRNQENDNSRKKITGKNGYNTLELERTKCFTWKGPNWLSLFPFHSRKRKTLAHSFPLALSA